MASTAEQHSLQFSAPQCIVIQFSSVQYSLVYFSTAQHPVNMLDPICIWSRSTWKRWPDVGLMIRAHWPRLESFGQNLTHLARTKSDPGWFFTVWSGPSVEECNWVWKWETSSGPIVFCYNQAWWPCTSACFRTRCVWPKPYQAIQIRSEPVMHNVIQAAFGGMELNRIQEVRSGIYNLAQLWLHAGHNGNKWP